MNKDSYNYQELILPRDSEKITIMINIIEKMINRTYFNMIDDGISFCKFNFAKNDENRRLHIPKNMKFANDNGRRDTLKSIGVSLVSPDFEEARFSKYTITVSSDMTLYLHVDVFDVITNELVMEVSTSFSANSNHTGRFKSPESFLQFQKVIYSIWNSILDINISFHIHENGIKCLTRDEFYNSSFVLGRFDVNKSEGA